MSFREKFDSGEFSVLAQIDPPKGTDTTSLVATATNIAPVVDAFLVTDMPGAIMTMDPLGATTVLRSQGFDVVTQIACLHRNRIALQGALISAAACGAAGVLISSGDEPESGDHPDATAVHDLSAATLMEAFACLAAGTDLNRSPLQGSVDLLGGCSIESDLSEGGLDPAFEEMELKAQKGAQFLVSTPVFDMDAVTPLVERAHGIRIPLFLHILVLKSLGMARYLDLHASGVHIPPRVFDRLQNARQTAEECICLAADLLRTAREIGASGALLSAFGWESRIGEVVGASVT